MTNLDSDWLKQLTLIDFLPTDDEIYYYKTGKHKPNLWFDLWKSMAPASAKTIPMELTQVQPLSAPSGMLFYLDYESKLK